MNISQTFRLWLTLVMTTAFAFALSAQDVTVSGVVSDDTGEPLMGATILLKGTSKGVSTNLDGEYTFTAPKNGTLVVSYIGYDTQEVKIEGRTKLDIVLKSDAEMLEEVVAIGYGTVKKKDLTGAVSSVSGSELVKVPVATAAQALQGKAAGLNIVSQSHAPGAGMNVTVRGGASLTQGTEPLYIVDGFAMDNALANIDINDIETIDVLKDASATAIYGARGSNGIIVITTKSGKAGKTKLDYNAFFSWDRLSKKLDMMDNTADYVRYQYEFAELRNKQTAYNQIYDDNYGLSTEDYYTGAYARIAERYGDAPSIDWQDKVFGGSAFSQNHNVSLSTGSEKTQILISYNHADQDGLLANHDYQRNSIRAKMNAELWKGVKVDFGMFFYHNNTHGGGNFSGMGNVLLAPISGGSLYTNEELLETQFKPTYFNSDNAFRPANPIVENLAVLSEKRSRRLDINGGVTIDFLKDFRWRTAVNYVTGWDKSTKYEDENSLNAIQNGKVEGINGSIKNNEKYSWHVNNTLTWNHTFNKIHDVTLMVGQEYSYSESEGNGIELRKFPTPNHGLDDISKADVKSKSTSHSNGNMLSFFARANYSYDNRYLFTATFRADGSSKFAKGNKWGYFPSVSGAWRVSQENFWKESSLANWFENLKFRVGYGVTGNCDISSHMYETTVSMSTYPNGSEFDPVFTLGSRLGNPDLKWETLHATNVGLDLGMFNNRINLSVEWYNNQVSDMLMSCTIPSTTGFTSQYQNVGKMRNRGWEFSLNTVNIASHGFQWTSTLNMSFNKSKVISLEGHETQKTFSASSDNHRAQLNYYALVGEPLGYMFGFKYDGIYTTDDFNELPDGTWELKEGVVKPYSGTPKPGDIKFAADNEDGTQFTRKYQKIGNGTPDFFGGFSNQFTYKGFDLNVFMKFSVGNDVFNGMKSSMMPFSPFENMPKEFGNNYYRLVDPETGHMATTLARLRELNPNESARTWSLSDNNSTTITYPSSYWVEDGSYLRLAQVTLGYTLPSKWMKKAHISNLRLYFTANNLCTITGYSGYDPDASSSNSDVICTPGYDYSSYPLSRSYVVGVNLSF